jgi:hypothetical protein
VHRFRRNHRWLSRDLRRCGTVVASATPPAGQQVGVALTTAADAAAVRVQFGR